MNRRYSTRDYGLRRGMLHYSENRRICFKSSSNKYNSIMEDQSMDATSLVEAVTI